MKIIFETKYFTLHENKLKKIKLVREYERIKEERRGRKKKERKKERKKGERKSERKKEKERSMSYNKTGNIHYHY